MDFMSLFLVRGGIERSLLLTLALASPFAIGIVKGLNALHASYAVSLATTFVFVAAFSAFGATLEDHRRHGTLHSLDPEASGGGSDDGPYSSV